MGVNWGNYAKCLADNMHSVSSAFIVVLFVVIIIIAQYHKLVSWLWFDSKQVHPQGCVSELASRPLTRLRRSFPHLQ